MSSALTFVHHHHPSLSFTDMQWLSNTTAARSLSPSCHHQSQQQPLLRLTSLPLSPNIGLPILMSADRSLQQQQQQNLLNFNLSPSSESSATSSRCDSSSIGSRVLLLPASRYKTELCRPYEESGHCRYGDKCQFAHGRGELRALSRHPKYKTERCRTFHTVGFCAYGSRCHFIHNDAERLMTSKSKSALVPSSPAHPLRSPVASRSASVSATQSSLYGNSISMLLPPHNVEQCIRDLHSCTNDVLHYSAAVSSSASSSPQSYGSVLESSVCSCHSDSEEEHFGSVFYFGSQPFTSPPSVDSLISNSSSSPFSRNVGLIDSC